MTAKDMKSRYDQILAEARDLRKRREQNDAAFLIYLTRIATEEFEVLSTMGHPTFASFLKETGLCDPARFTRFATGLTAVGEETARDIGAEAVIALAYATSPKAAEKFVPNILAWSEQHGGVRVSRETAVRILKQVDPREEQPRAGKTQSELVELRITNARLRKELADALGKLGKLETERDSLKARCVQYSKEIESLKKSQRRK